MLKLFKLNWGEIEKAQWYYKRIKEGDKTMNRITTIKYLEKRKLELSTWMSEIRDFKEKECLFSKYIKVVALLDMLKEEEKNN